jgi:hypothetical protein
MSYNRAISGILFIVRSSFLSHCESVSSAGSESRVFNDQKIKSLNILSMKDVQVAGEAFSPKKTTASTSKPELSSLFSIFAGHFCTPGFESSRQ